MKRVLMMRVDIPLDLDKNKTDPISKITRPFQDFFDMEVSGGLVLMAAVLLAMALANSPLSDQFFDLWQTQVTVGAGGIFLLTKPLILWINDGLMAVFFLLVGLELKRELLVGELASPKQALFPAVGALGGAFFPALIFVVLNLGRESLSGWAIPMATDIAFSLGLLALLGTRAPVTLKIFLATMAIVDDLLAVTVIALFYTSKLDPTYLVVAGVVVLTLISFNLLGGRRTLVYGILGLVLWFLVLKSGVHATIAGVLLAMTIPARQKINLPEFRYISKHLIAHLDQTIPDNPILTEELHHATIYELEKTAAKTEAPLVRLEHSVQPWVAFLVVPIFALANAGVNVFSSVDLSDLLTHPLTYGILLGLVVGKPFGITLALWLVDRLGWANKPSEVSWLQVHGVTWLAGVGFTMSHFIAALAFTDVDLVNLARLVILLASTIAGVVGLAVLWYASTKMSKSEDP